MAQPTVTGSRDRGDARPAVERRRGVSVGRPVRLRGGGVLPGGRGPAYAPRASRARTGTGTSEAGTAPYKTRIIVRRPADAGDFSGTVYVEWLNVTAGVDGDPDFGLNHRFLGDGSAYVGVSAQRASIEGGGVLTVPGVQVQALKQWDPERYGDLVHPGDNYSYDITSQAARGPPAGGRGRARRARRPQRHRHGRVAVRRPHGDLRQRSAPGGRHLRRASWSTAGAVAGLRWRTRPTSSARGWPASATTSTCR